MLRGRSLFQALQVASSRRLGPLVILPVFAILFSGVASAGPDETPQLKDGTVPDLARCEGTFDEPPIVSRIARPTPPQDVIWRYDPFAMRYSMFWEVVVHFDVDEKGRPRNIRSDATDPPIIGRAANTTLAAWRFRPAKHNGKSVGARCRTLLEYDLRTSEMIKKQAASKGDGGR